MKTLETWKYGTSLEMRNILAAVIQTITLQQNWTLKFISYMSNNHKWHWHLSVDRSVQLK